MKRVEQAVTHIKNAIDQKTILEVACGCAEFSISASKFAKQVNCIDLEGKRLSPAWETVPNMQFDIMDAANMLFKSNTFDTIIVYNALEHIRYNLENILKECRRVLRHDGNIYIISSYKMDKAIIEEYLIPILKENPIDFCSDIVPPFYYIRFNSMFVPKETPFT
ncbi:MAG TPA: class I SAM-dependent methyltransferase [Clostridia bacterium]|nr:class I SAM-dependent methyltransferase [Clostridia bacterium]